jgi:Concanavalin A-like lectin/glucanases superfamily
MFRRRKRLKQGSRIADNRGMPHNAARVFLAVAAFWFFCWSPTFAVSIPPLVKNLTLWYDASNSGSITKTTTVSQWNDLSGTGANVVQATTANQPTYTASCMNSLACLSFNGSSDFLHAASGFPTSSDYTIAAIAKFNANTATILGGSNGAVTSYAFWGANAETPALYQGGTTFAKAASVGTAAFLAVATLQDSNAAGNMYVNGGAPATGSSPSLHVADSTIEVGASTGGNYLSGNIAELLVYSRILSTAEQQYIEGYLACKWGLQISLPTGHPYYKTIACSVSGTAGLTISTAVAPTGAQVPGTNLTYTSTYTNAAGLLDYNPVLTLPVPTNTSFQLSSASANLETTGLTLSSTTYSNSSGYGYTPVSGGGGAPSGYDATVTNVRYTFSGALGCGSVNNVGTVAFIAQIQ